MFSSKLVGKKKHTDVDTRKIDDTTPIGTDHLPRFHGPYSNLFRDTVTLKIIGIAYDIE